MHKSASVTSSSSQHQSIGGVDKKQTYDEFMRELETNKSYARDLNLFRRVSLYRIRGELGTGNFSLVKMAMHELTNEKVALKVFMKDKLEPQAYEMALAEIANQATLEHPHIIRLYEAIQTPTRLYMATEFAGGGELFFKVADEGRLSDPNAKVIFRQILDAVSFLHSKLIIHRDLKAENVMFSSTGQNWIKLGDFGFSTRVKARDEMLTTFCGSPPYAAPELYRDDKYDGFMADVWSLGVLLYFIVTGMLPFRSSNLGELRKLITTGRYRIPEALPLPCRNLLQQLLGQVPSARPGTEEIAKCEWLCDVALPSASFSQKLADEQLRVERAEKATKLLEDIGIDGQRLEGEAKKSVWSAVNGCHRIVSHRLEKSYCGEPETHDFPFHLYNLGFEPQRYRVSSGDVVTVSNAAVHQAAQQQQQQKQQQELDEKKQLEEKKKQQQQQNNNSKSHHNNHHHNTVGPEQENSNHKQHHGKKSHRRSSDYDDETSTSSCLPTPGRRYRNSDNSTGTGSVRTQQSSTNSKPSTVCSIL